MLKAKLRQAQRLRHILNIFLLLLGLLLFGSMAVTHPPQPQSAAFFPVQARIEQREAKTRVRIAGEVRVNPKDGLKYVWITPGTVVMVRQ